MKAALVTVIAASLVTLVSCAQRPGSEASSANASQRAAAVRTASPAPSPQPPAAAAAIATSSEPEFAGPLPGVLVHKSPTCGCCAKWVTHMRDAGFTVKVNNTDNLEPIKKRLGGPLGKGSCHTAEIGKLVVEGHVPSADIKRLLAANDGSKGLVLPGMPGGSPGMEMPDGRVQRYTVERINADGSTSPFATHGE